MTFKSNMAQHRNKSHRGSYELVAGVRLSDFKDHYYIDRVRDRETVTLLLSVFGNNKLWKAIRASPELTQSLFSGLSSGEFKPFLKSAGKLAERVSFHTKGE